MASVKQLRGRLFTRGKKGIYYLEHYMPQFDAAGHRTKGKRIIQRLPDEHGKPITRKPKAEAARDQILKPYIARSEAELRRSVWQEYQAAEETAKKLEEQQEAEVKARERTRLDEVWEKQPYEYTTPKKHSKRRKRKLSDASIRDYRQQWEKFVRWFAANHPDQLYADEVTPEHAQAYSDFLRNDEKLSANRHNKLLQTAGVMFRAAGLENPFENVDYYEVDAATREPLTDEELAKVCQSAEGEYRRLFAVAIYSGMRLKDCCLCEWGKNIDLTHNLLFKVTSKTKAPVSFPLHPVLRTILEEVPAQSRKGFVCPELAELYENGQRWRISLTVRELFEAEGLVTQQTGTDSKRKIALGSFHSFRHTFITLCARGGIPEGKVMQWIGHKSQDVHRLYQHWAPKEGEQEIINALPANFGTTPQLPARPEDERRTHLHKLVDELPNDQIKKDFELSQDFDPTPQP